MSGLLPEMSLGELERHLLEQLMVLWYKVPPAARPEDTETDKIVNIVYNRVSPRSIATQLKDTAEHLIKRYDSMWKYKDRKRDEAVIEAEQKGYERGLEVGRQQGRDAMMADLELAIARYKESQ